MDAGTGGGMWALGHCCCWGQLTGVLSAFRAGRKELRLTRGKMPISRYIKLQTGLDSCSKSSCPLLFSVTHVSVQAIHQHQAWQIQHLSYKQFHDLAWSISNGGGKTRYAFFLNHTCLNTDALNLLQGKAQKWFPITNLLSEGAFWCFCAVWRPVMCHRGRGSCICVWWFVEV